MTAADVLGRYLIAREDVPVYDLPNGNRIGEIKKGNSTAEVYSYVVRNGQVWWMFDYTIPGQSPSAYYVMQKDGRFSLSAAPGNVAVSANVLPSVDVFPAVGKNMLIYGALGLAALLIITRK
jgi:hypothetical protein